MYVTLIVDRVEWEKKQLALDEEKGLNQSWSIFNSGYEVDFVSSIILFFHCIAKCLI